MALLHHIQHHLRHRRRVEEHVGVVGVGHGAGAFFALDAGTAGLHGLAAAEIAHLPEAGLLITLETGMRFLTDHLAGDTYFKIHRPDHNLDRCRTQFALVARLEEQLPELRAIVERHCGPTQ